MNQEGAMVENTPMRKRRLNPFAFPLETNAFFALLAITAPVWMLELGQVVGIGTGLIQSGDLLATASSIENEGVVSLDVRRLSFSLILVLLVFALATIIFLSHPLRIRFRKGLRQIRRDQDPKFVDAVQELIDLSQVSPSPRIEVATSSYSVAGQAFGLWRNYSLLLGNRFRLLFRQDIASFRGIILHELAHIANHDISRTYFTQALWIAVIGLTVIPTILLSLARLSTPIILLSLLKISGAIFIITAIYSYILRSREFYADWKAALWGEETSLIKILQRNLLIKDKGNRWTRFWRLHPTIQERLSVLQDPGELFRVRPILPFLVGALPGLMLGGLFSQLELLLFLLAFMGTQLQRIFGGDLFNNDQNLTLIYFMLITLFAIPGIVITYLLTQSLGFAVQRYTIAEMEAGHAGWPVYLSLWKPALLVALGYQVGSLLPISSMLEIIPALLQSGSGLFFILLLLILLVAFAFITWLGLLYVSVFTRQVLGSHAKKSSPKVKMRLLTLALSGLFLISYIPMVLAQFFIDSAATAGDTSILIDWMPGVGLTEAVALLAFLLVFAVTWVVVGVSRKLRRLQCPTCGHATRHQFAVAQTCESCGNELAPWLYTA
jgi:peptidase M48-like protein